VLQKPVTALVVATTPWPIAARVAIRLVAHGCEVFALCPRGHVLNYVSGLRRIHRYAGRDSMAQLAATIEEVSPNIVVPCDDRAVWQLHELHEQKARFRGVIEASLGAAGHFPTLRSRNQLIETARSLGLPIPRTEIITGPAEIRAWFERSPGPAVMKVDGTWGGRGVEFVRSAEEGLAAWRMFVRARPVGFAWKQRLINHDPLAFWRGADRLGRSVSLQTFIPGELANTMVTCWRGEVLGTVSVKVLCTQGSAGASTIIRICQDENMTRAAVRLAKELELSGFFGLDYVVEAGTGKAYLIELNPRCTQLGHLVLPGQGDLIGMLCSKLGASGDGKLATPMTSDTIALFPQALAWNPDSPYLHRCYHDVPWTEPALIRELLRDPWAERRLISRLYHGLRGRKREPAPDLRTFKQLAAASGWPNPFPDIQEQQNGASASA
jgi:ATP-grasp domain